MINKCLSDVEQRVEVGSLIKRSSIMFRLSTGPDIGLNRRHKLSRSAEQVNPRQAAHVEAISVDRHPGDICVSSLLTIR
jgi:hypothetical protein